MRRMRSFACERQSAAGDSRRDRRAARRRRRSAASQRDERSPTKRGVGRQVVAEDRANAQEPARQRRGSPRCAAAMRAKFAGERIGDLDRRARARRCRRRSASSPRPRARAGRAARRAARLSRTVASSRCGSFCEPSIAICCVRCGSAGLPKRCTSASRYAREVDAGRHAQASAPPRRSIKPRACSATKTGSRRRPGRCIRGRRGSRDRRAPNGCR